jgi:hypothetical protein
VSTETRSSRLQYAVVSDIAGPDEASLRSDVSAEYSDDIRRLYLQLPKNPEGVSRLDPRIEDLARQITRGAITTYEKAAAVENYLKDNFGYSLDVAISTEDPLADFLFRARQGHCEYFATAMAVLLRSIDVPARVVNGFQMGEYNDVNNMYTVRELDAHSWVEVYFAGVGAWVEFDPTPPAGINSYSSGGLLARLRKYLEAAEVFWMDYIVTLSGEQQASIMVGLQQKLVGVKDWISGQYLSLKKWLIMHVAYLIWERKWSLSDALWIGLPLALIVLGFLAYSVGTSYRKVRRLKNRGGQGGWLQRMLLGLAWRRALKSKEGHRTGAILFYERMLSMLARRGVGKRSYQTPLEFAQECGLEEVSEITRFYNRVRFGGQDLDDYEASRVSDLLSQLKQTVRKLPR